MSNAIAALIVWLFKLVNDDLIKFEIQCLSHTSQ